MASHQHRIKLVFIPVILALIGVGITGMIDVADPGQKVWVAGLIVLFAVIFFYSTFYKVPHWAEHILLAIETALVAVLMIIRPGWSVFPILFFIISPQAMSSFSQRMGLIWIGVFTLVTGVIFVAFDGLLGLLVLLPYVAGYSFFGVFGWITLQAERERLRSEQLLAELQEAHHQLQEYASRVEELTITPERNRIAREMHDSLGHRLTISSVQLEGAQRLIRSKPERAEEIIGTVRGQIREGLGELRRTVAMLRASVEEDLPLQQALPKLAEQVQEATGLHIHLSLEDCRDDLPQPVRHALFRAAQEGLTNIHRHARATEAWLRLTTSTDQITLMIADNGIGLSTEQGQEGFGLAGLKERASLLGGSFHTDPRPGGGAQLTFRLPLPAQESNLLTAHDNQICQE